MTSKGTPPVSPTDKPLKKERSALLLRALEPRMLLDAAGAVTASKAASDVAADHHDQTPPPAVAPTTDLMRALGMQQAERNSPSDQRTESAHDGGATSRHDIYFIDAAVEDSRELVNDLPPGAEVHILDGHRDGVEQIAEVVGHRKGIDAIHILGHGHEGSLQLGSGVLDRASVEGQYRDELAIIKSALSESADLLIYGCDFAGTEAGRQLADQLAFITGADVAASTDYTGASSLGGDWDLEYQHGDINAAVVSSDDWHHLMAPPSIDLDTGRDGTGSVITYDGGSVSIGDNISIKDPDNTWLSSMTIKLDNAGEGDFLYLSSQQDYITYTYDPETGIMTLSGVRPTSEYQDAIDDVRFSTQRGDVESRTIRVSAISYNGALDTNEAVAIINISDTDGDGVLNTVDIDDDNDGIVNGREKTVTEDTVDFSARNGQSHTFITSGGSEGVVFDVFTLDNSFNITINGKAISDSDIQFYSAGSGNQVRFQDGTAYSSIWTMSGSADHPLVRVTVDVEGNVKLFGSRTSGGPLEELVVYKGNDISDGNIYNFEKVEWSSSGEDVVVVSQEVIGATYITGRSYGYKVVDVDEDEDGVGDSLDIDVDNDGITDNVEAQSSKDYVAPSGVDEDGDGLDDAYDASIGDTSAVGSIGLIPVDTDGDGVDDYQDDDSDDDGRLDIVERGDGQASEITDTTDTDGDGLLDIFEGGDSDDGYDANDDNLSDGIFNLADSDGDVAGDGSNARSLVSDFDYRDDPDVNPPEAVDDEVELKEDTSLDVGLDDGVMSNDAYAGDGTIIKATIDTDGDGKADATFALGKATDIKDADGNIVGTLTLEADGAYSFIPAANFFGEVPVITYVVKTAYGTSSANIHIKVTAVNDAPVAEDDRNTATEDTPLVVNKASGVLANDTDADGDTLTVSGFTIDGKEYKAGDHAVIEGVGTLTLRADGSYRFVPADNYHGTVPEIIYTVTDGGDDTATATLTLDITAVDDVVVVDGLDDGTADGTDGRVQESALSDGSDGSGGGTVRHTGSFTVGPAGGLDSVTIVGKETDGTEISIAELLASGETPVVIEGAYGTLTIKGYDARTGKVSYVYVLTSRANHANDATISDSFAISVTDVEGDVTSNAGSLAIAIVDDVPVAEADSDSVINIPDQPSSTADGNVITGKGGQDPGTSDGSSDTAGADGAVVSGVVSGEGEGVEPVATDVGKEITGKYGTLTLNADGSYSYMPDFTNETVKGLKGGSSVSDIFTYQITDADGDTSVATLEIDVSSTPTMMDTTGGVVRESDLAEGSNPDGNADVYNGDFRVVLSEDFPLDTLTVGDQTFTLDQLLAFSKDSPSPKILTEHGYIVITGYQQGDNATDTVSYRFVLEKPATQSGAQVFDSVDMSLTDAGGNDTSAYAKPLSVAIRDDAGVATDDAGSAAEDNAKTISGSVVDNDVLGADGLDSPVTAVGTDENTTTADNVGAEIDGTYGRLTLNADGSYSYELDNSNPKVDGLQKGEVLTETFTYQITDADGDVSIATLTLTISGTNDAPVVPDVPDVETPEDTPVDGEIIAEDVDGDELTYIVTDGPSHGELVVNDDGTFTYTPEENYNGDDSFTVEVSDGNGGTTTVTIPVTVTEVNDVPVTSPDTASLAEDTPLVVDADEGVLANDTDVDDDPLSVTGFEIEGVDGTFSAGETAVIDGVGELTLNEDGSYSFVPEPDYDGKVPVITYIVTDGAGGSATGTLNVTISGTNDAPVVPNAPELETPEDVPVDGEIIAEDVDGDELTFKVIDGPSSGTVVINDDGTFTYTPEENYNGKDSFTVEVSDGNGGTTTVTVPVSVLPVNDVPVTSPDTANLVEDTPLVVDADEGVLANDTDVDGDPLSVTGFEIEGVDGTIAAGETAVIEGVGELTLNTDGSWSFVPEPDYHGEVPVITYTVTDGAGSTATGTLNLTVTEVDDKVVIDGLDDGRDVDGGGASDGAVKEASLPDGSHPGNDGRSSSGDMTIHNLDALTSIQIGDTTISRDELIAAGDRPIVIEGRFGTLTIDGFDMQTGKISYVYELSHSADHTQGAVRDVFALVVTDTDGDVDRHAGSLAIAVLDDAPAATADAGSVNEDAADATRGNVIDNDIAGVDGAEIQVTSITGDGGEADAGMPVDGRFGQLVMNTDGSYRYVLDNDNPQVDALQVGESLTEVFTYQVVDADGSLSEATLTLTIHGANDAPEATVVPAEGQQDTPIEGNIPVVDVDGDDVSFTIVTPPENGSLVINDDGSFIYVPEPGTSGTDSFTVVVDDGHGGTTTITIPVIVEDINDAPEAYADPVEGKEDTPVDGKVFAEDLDGDSLDFSVPEQPANGSVIIHKDGSYTYIPDNGFTGEDSFVVIVSDGRGGQAEVVVHITIKPAADHYVPSIAPAALEEGAVEPVEADASTPSRPMISDAVNELSDLGGLRDITADRAVEQAVDAASDLGGQPELGANGVVLATVNAIDPLRDHSAAENLRHDRMAEPGGAQPVMHASNIAGDGRVAVDLAIEASQARLSIGDLVADVQGGVTHIDIRMASGAALPGWINTGTRGDVIIDRVPGAEQISLRVNLEREGGGTHSYRVTLDLNAGEVNVSSLNGRPHQASAAAPFADQLAQASSWNGDLAEGLTRNDELKQG